MMRGASHPRHGRGSGRTPAHARFPRRSQAPLLLASPLPEANSFKQGSSRTRWSVLVRSLRMRPGPMPNADNRPALGRQTHLPENGTAFLIGVCHRNGHVGCDSPLGSRGPRPGRDCLGVEAKGPASRQQAANSIHGVSRISQVGSLVAATTLIHATSDSRSASQGWPRQKQLRPKNTLPMRQRRNRRLPPSPLSNELHPSARLNCVKTPANAGANAFHCLPDARA
jgi:hypothetical protein